MITQNSQHKLIRARLEKLSTTTIESIQSVDQPTSKNISNETLDSLNHNEEKIAHQRKDWQYFTIKIFFTKFTELNKRANKAYLKIIHDFILFSTDNEYEDLVQFMENKFNIISLRSDFKAPYEANQAKYALLFKKFLKSIKTIDDINIKVLHYNKIIKLVKILKQRWHIKMHFVHMKI